MRFVEIIYKKKFTLISIFLFLYVILNLLDGERGLISYYEKLKLKDLLGEEKKSLTLELNLVEKKNSLLTDIVDLDYLETLYRKKFTLISIFLFLYVIFNLLDGERGLISYYEKQKRIEQLFQEKESLVLKLDLIEKKNSLLTDIIDTDYLETLYRKKFMVGKINEEIYINK